MSIADELNDNITLQNNYTLLDQLVSEVLEEMGF